MARAAAQPPSQQIGVAASLEPGLITSSDCVWKMDQFQCVKLPELYAKHLRMNLPPTTAPCLYRWILLWPPMFVARRKLLSISRWQAEFRGKRILCDQSKVGAVMTRYCSVL